LEAEIGRVQGKPRPVQGSVKKSIGASVFSLYAVIIDHTGTLSVEGVCGREGDVGRCLIRSLLSF
jgi:hypothetical protein